MRVVHKTAVLSLSKKTRHGQHIIVKLSDMPEAVDMRYRYTRKRLNFPTPELLEAAAYFVRDDLESDGYKVLVPSQYKQSA